MIVPGTGDSPTLVRSGCEQTESRRGAQKEEKDADLFLPRNSAARNRLFD